MKKYLVRVSGSYEHLHNELTPLKIVFIEECIPRRTTKYLSVIATEEQLISLRLKYQIEIEGELAELASRLQAMVGKGNRFKEDILNTEIL